MTTVSTDPTDRELDTGDAAAKPAAAGAEVVSAYDDGTADKALGFVADVLAQMGMDAHVDLLEPEEGDSPDEVRLEIEGEDSGRIIGKKGLVLGALQYLANRVVNRPGQARRRHVLVDAEGYQERRDETLAAMAHRLGQKAVDEGKIITFEPMNAKERRVVHMALAKFAGVVTTSDGEGEARRVQIIPVRR